MLTRHVPWISYVISLRHSYPNLIILTQTSKHVIRFPYESSCCVLLFPLSDFLLLTQIWISRLYDYLYDLKPSLLFIRIWCDNFCKVDAFVSITRLCCNGCPICRLVAVDCALVLFDIHLRSRKSQVNARLYAKKIFCFQIMHSFGCPDPAH